MENFKEREQYNLIQDLKWSLWILETLAMVVVQEKHGGGLSSWAVGEDGERW